MKKLITLILVLCAGVMNVSATTYTVYFKPDSNWKDASARFALYMFTKSGGVTTAETWVDFYYDSDNTVYKATYNTTYSTGMVICRMNPAYSDNKWDYKWNQSADLDVPTSNVYYDKSENDAYDSWSSASPTVVLTPTTRTYSLNAGGGLEDHMPNYMDTNSEAGVTLTSNGDFTYSRTVTGNVIPHGTYGIKVTDDADNTYDNEGDTWTVSGISTEEDAVYNIVYSFNLFTGVASGVATKQGDATITTKYVFAGDEALLGHNWDTSGDYNVMNVSDGTGTLALNSVDIPSGTYYYKAVKLLFNNGAKYKTIWEDGDNSNWTFSRASKYTGTLSCTISTLESSASFTEDAGYFIYGGTGDWSLGERMTYNDGEYSYTFNNSNGYGFVIIPTSNLSSTNIPNWDGEAEGKYIYRPNAESVSLDFTNKNGSTQTEKDNNKKWVINYDGYVKVSFDPEGSWNSAPYFERTISSDKYATFSSDYAVAIPAGITASYATGVENGNISLTNFSKGIPANTGALLYGGAGTYPFTPASETDEVSGNKFVAGTGTSVSQTTTIDKVDYTNFILTNKTVDNESAPLKFYKINSAKIVVPTGKAYLQIPTASVGAREFFWFGETTGIDAVEKVNAVKGQYFNLAGQRVAQPTKGLYIVNGKKVVIK